MSSRRPCSAVPRPVGCRHVHRCVVGGAFVGARIYSRYTRSIRVGLADEGVSGVAAEPVGVGRGPRRSPARASAGASMSMVVAPSGGRPTAVPAPSLAPESSRAQRPSLVTTPPPVPSPASPLPLPTPVPGASGLSECVSRLRVVVGEVVAAAGVARAAAAADPGVGAAAVGAAAVEVLGVLDEVATVLGVARAEVAGVVRFSGSWRRTPAGRRVGDFCRASDLVAGVVSC